MRDPAALSLNLSAIGARGGAALQLDLAQTYKVAWVELNGVSAELGSIALAYDVPCQFDGHACGVGGIALFSGIACDMEGMASEVGEFSLAAGSLLALSGGAVSHAEIAFKFGFSMAIDGQSDAAGILRVTHRPTLTAVPVVSVTKRRTALNLRGDAFYNHADNLILNIGGTPTAVPPPMKVIMSVTSC